MLSFAWPVYILSILKNIFYTFMLPPTLFIGSSKSNNSDFSFEEIKFFSIIFLPAIFKTLYHHSGPWSSQPVATLSFRKCTCILTEQVFSLENSYCCRPRAIPQTQNNKTVRMSIIHTTSRVLSIRCLEYSKGLLPHLRKEEMLE